MALKKLSPDTSSRHLYAVRMWRDDIAEIIAMLKTLGDQKITIKLHVGRVEYAVDAIDDLDQLRDDHIDDLVITHPRGEVKLTLGDINRITTNDADLQTRAVVEQIEHYTRRKGRLRLYQWLYATQRWRGPILSLSAMGVSLYLLMRSESSNWQSLEVRHWVSAAIGLILSLALLIMARPNKSKIYARRRVDLPPFWQRKRDDIVIAVVSLIAGGVIGYWINTIS